MQPHWCESQVPAIYFADRAYPNYKNAGSALMIISVKSRIMNHLIGYLREFPLAGSRVH